MLNATAASIIAEQEDAVESEKNTFSIQHGEEIEFPNKMRTIDEEDKNLSQSNSVESKHTETQALDFGNGRGHNAQRKSRKESVQDFHFIHVTRTVQKNNLGLGNASSVVKANVIVVERNLL